MDQCLKKIADAENEMTAIEAEMNKKIAEIKKNAGEVSRQHKETIKQNEGKIKEYATVHKDGMNGKSKLLTFGKVGFRLSTKLLLPSSIADVIMKLRENGMLDCINVKETVDKDAVKNYGEDDILKIGGYLQKNDTFWYETDRDALAGQ